MAATTLDQRMKVLRLCLHRHRVKMTPQRIKIAEAMLREQRHISAEGLLDELDLASAQVSRASVYRTLQLLEQLELVRGIDTRARGRFFEPAPLSVAEDHAHLVCTSCGSIVDVPVLGAGDAALRAAADLGFRVASRSVHLTGTCKGCVEGGPRQTSSGAPAASAR
jgi:Fe2+ or Zn2+ uptake regulation protein